MVTAVRGRRKFFERPEVPRPIRLTLRDAALLENIARFRLASAAQLAPSYDLSNAKPIQIAPGVLGTTFTDTKYPGFGNATENVWFSYRGNLYDVTTDAKDGALFKSILATWTFI